MNIESDLHMTTIEITYKLDTDRVVKFESVDFDQALDKQEFLHKQLKKLVAGTEYNAFDGVHILMDFMDSAQNSTVLVGINNETK